MSIEAIIAISMGSIVGLIVSVLIYRRIPKRLKQDVFDQKWAELQQYCKDKNTWPKAITEADALLDRALKKRKFKGKSRGERLVSAQRILNNNDTVWFAHNLYKKIIAEPDVRLKEDDVKTALVGFRQALRDLGALKDSESKKV